MIGNQEFKGFSCNQLSFSKTEYTYDFDEDDDG